LLAEGDVPNAEALRYFVNRTPLAMNVRLVLASALGAGIALGADALLDRSVSPPARDVAADIPVSFTSSDLSAAAAGLDFRPAAAASVDAVVHVKTVSRSRMPYNPWMDLFGYTMPEQVQQGSGSGVVFGPEGFIITNHHVIDGAEEIEVSTNDNTTFTATVVGSDPTTDLAVLKVDAPEAGLPFMRFGDSDAVTVGEWVLAVGNPFDLTSTVTAGIVSAKARNLSILRPDYARGAPPIESFIQTDAAVNPGNSGGALVNTRGELIGINTAIASATGSYSGYSFAVPSSIVRKVAEDLVAYGRVQRAFLGVQVEAAERTKGVVIESITPGSGAAEADLRTGDILVAIQGKEVRSFAELQDAIARFRPGDRVAVERLRGGEKGVVDVELRDASGSTRLLNRSELEERTSFGVRFADLSAHEARRWGMKAAARIAEVGDGPFRSAGIPEGFIVTRIEGKPVATAQDAHEILLLASGNIVVEGYLPQGRGAAFAVKLGGQAGTK
jgi:Do/DeqQ family serine protease